MKRFIYKGLKFFNIKDNLYQTKKFGDKLIYEFKDGKYHLVKDERLNPVIQPEELNKNPNSYCNNDYWWK